MKAFLSERKASASVCDCHDAASSPPPAPLSRYSTGRDTLSSAGRCTVTGMVRFIEAEYTWS